MSEFPILNEDLSGSFLIDSRDSLSGLETRKFIPSLASDYLETFDSKPHQQATNFNELVANHNLFTKTKSFFSSTNSTNSEFAVVTEGTININGGGDFDGIPTDIKDDALIHARKGFTINGQPTLPVKRDSLGNPIKTNTGKLILVNHAVTVAPGYTVSNVSNNNYSNLIPPQIISPLTVAIPSYTSLKNQVYTDSIPTNTPTITFNSGQNPINNAAQWAVKFPQAGTEGNPTVVKVINGGLNIPSQVDLNHYVITVENGDINFNGSGQDLNKVVLVANNGNINLSNLHATNSSVLANKSINMNGGALFAGTGLLATGTNTGNINFNGATATTNPSDFLQVISQGQITYNGASNTRGNFQSVSTYTFNGNSSLYGSIEAKGNIFFNGNAKVFAVYPSNNAPSDINLTPNLITENSPNNTVVGTFSTTDADGEDSHNYQLVSGMGSTDNAAFSVVGNQLLIKNSPNFENQSTYNIRVSTTDEGGLSLEKIITVTVTNVNEAPTDLILSASNIIENSPANTVVGTLSTEDPDNGDSHIYSLVSGVGDTDNNAFAIVDNQLRILTSPDFESQPSYQIRVKTSDEGGLSLEKELTVNVTDVPDLGLSEGTRFSTTLTKNIQIPQTPSQLSFKIDSLFFDETDKNSINDALEVALIDADGNSLVHTIRPDGDSFFNLTEGETPEVATGVSYSNNIVTVNLTGITPNNEATLVFRLVNNDNDTNTKVELSDIHITAAPTGSSKPEETANTNSVLPVGNIIDLSQLEDVSLSTVARYQYTSFNTKEALLYVDTLVQNIGKYGIDGPLYAVVTNISDPSVTMRSPDGFTVDGRPYYKFTPTSNNGKLQPTQLTKNRTLVFNNPNLGQFTYDLVVKAKINAAPVIESSPITITKSLSPYTYDVKASDANEDHLTYSLLSGPVGLTIDSSTGKIAWTPTIADNGNHSIIWRVSDGRGLEAEQSYTLSVVSTLNRPPVITSVPAVDSYVNQTYSYQASALDLDKETLTFSLTKFPNGMTINSATGLVQWTPTSTQVGIFDVTLKVTDVFLNAALQNWKVQSSPTPSNSAPIIISDPITSGYVNSTYRYTVRALDPDNNSLTYSLVEKPTGMTIEANTGLISWNPTTVGQQNVTVSVRDSGGYTDTQNFQLNVGNSTTLGEIRGKVWEDTNANGVLDSQEKGSAEINVYLDLNRNQKLDAEEPKTTTDAAGAYQFSNLSPDTYVVREVLPPNFIQTFPEARPLLGFSILKNGSFEQGPNVSPPATYLAIPKNSTAIPFWNVKLTSVDYCTTRLWQASDGQISIDLDGTPGPGGITQTINTIPGQNYIVTFDLSAHPFLGTGLLRTMTVTAGGSSAEFVGKSGTSIDMRYQTKQWQFTANSTTTEMGFYSYKGDSYGPVIDNISVQPIIDPVDRSQVINLTSGKVVFDADFGNQPKPVSQNSVPIFTTNPENVPAAVGKLWRYQSSASDPDKDALTYELLLSPEGMTVDPQTGLVVWKPTLEQINRSNSIYLSAGVYNILLRVKDSRGGVDLQSFQVSITNNDTAPVFLTELLVKSAAKDRPWQYQFSAKDPEGDPVTYSLITPPAGASINTQTGLFKWTPQTTGEYTLVVQASDNKGGKTVEQFVLQVVGSLPNNSPTITSNARTETAVEQPYFYQVVANDSDNDPISYTLVDAPSEMTIDKQGLIVWTPKTNQLGTKEVTVLVSDGQGGSSSQTYELEVVNALGLALPPPQITGFPQKTTAVVGSTYNYTPVISNPDNDVINFVLEKAPTGMVIDETTGKIVWTPTNDQLGSQEVSLRVVGSRGGSFTQSFTLMVRSLNTNPTITSIPFTQAYAFKPYSYQVVANDLEQSTLTYELVQKPQGMTINTQTGLIQWTPNGILNPQAIEVKVSDGVGGSVNQLYAITISANAPNQPPTITSTPIFTAGTNQLYSYQVKASDPEGGNLTYSLQSPPTGMKINPTNGLVEWTPTSGQVGNYNLAVVVRDGVTGLTVVQRFGVNVSVNAIPVITNNPKTSVVVGQTYRYDIIANDGNGDELTYTLTQAPEGMTVDSLGRIRWTPELASLGTYPVKLTISDSRGASVLQEFNLLVNADVTNPQVKLLIATSPVAVGEEATFFVSASDNVAVSDLTLLVNGQSVAVDAMGVAKVKMNAAGDFSATIEATDEAGNIGSETISFSVLNFGDVNGPDISLNLAEGTSVTAPTKIIGTISDSNLLYYKVEVAPTSGGEWQEIARRNTNVVNGVLVEFDPSLLSNDAYILRFSAYDEGGNITTAERIVNVTGDLKLGNFQLSFTDLSIPVTGIPINLTRTYDTLTAPTIDDLGYGWRLEFRDTDLRTSLGPDEGYEKVGLRTVGFDEKTKVYITLPGGKRESFTFKPKDYNSLFNAFLRNAGGGLSSDPSLYVPSFVADAGVTSTLTVENTIIVRGANNQFYGFNGGAYNPANSEYSFGGYYLLTTKEGIKYRINANTGDVETVTDNNGNVLTFTDAGITSSTGVEITFARDAQGRITQVSDPEGEVIKYEYNSEGDLVAVTDREGNKTSFEYDSQQAHYLNKIIDPLGREGIRTEYNSEGRLKRILDVNGEAVELVYDRTNSLQTVKDQLGHSTTYEYDDRGNIVTEIDANGGITRHTYDEKDNLLTTTNPLGNKTKYTYDSADNLISLTDPLGKTAHYTYNSFGQVLSRTDPNGHTISYVYDSRRNLLSTINPEGYAVRETTDSFGNLTSLIDADGNITQFEYDLFGHLIREIDALGNQKTYTYDSNGNQLSETATVTTSEGPKQLLTSWVYDKEGRVLSKTDPLGNTIRQEYDDFGNLIALIEEGMNNRRTKYYYDSKNQLVKTLYADGTSEENIYDIAGRQIATIDQAGETTHFVYDALGRLIETIYPDETPSNLTDNPRTKTEYNKASQTIANVDERGYRTEYEYDLAGRRILERNALGQENTYTYDAMGNLITEADAQQRTTSYIYDPEGRKVETRFADGTSTHTTYSTKGLKIAQTNQAGQTTRFIYDALDRLIEVIHPDDTPNNLADNPRTETEYDELDRVVASIDELNNRTEYEYDLVGNLIESRTACLCRRLTSTYDAAGNRLTQTDPLGHTTRFVYDELDRLIKTNLPDETYTTTTYNSIGQVIAQTDQAGKKTQYKYDARQQLTDVIDARGQKTEYTYDQIGNLIAITDANHHITQYQYDALNRPLKTILPMGQQSMTTYDTVGNIASTTDFNGNTIAYTYDSLNRLIHQQLPVGQTIDYTYTSTGQVKSITDQRGVTAYNYDVRERLIEKIDPDSRFIRYGYDQASHVTSLITPSGTTNYTYDKFNQLKTVTDKNGHVTEYTYDQGGNLIQTKLPNNTVESRDYDNLNRLIFLKNALTNPITQEEIGIISSYQYTLDAVGNRLSVLEKDGRLEEYQYDDLYRLTQSKITDDNMIDTTNYTYDPVGNRLTRHNSDEGLTTYLYNANDWLLSEQENGGNITYTYDNNGNTLERMKDATEQVVYTWDEQNRLIAAAITSATGTTETEYQYNTDGIRVASQIDGVETRYLIDANRPNAMVLEEYAPNGTVNASYVYGLDLISQVRGGLESFYHVDGLGSTRVLTDGNGGITDTYTYDAYGNLISSTGSTVNNYLYTGEQYDSNLGDYYLRSRYYDPSGGRFISRDTFEGVFTEPLSLAKYPYVQGNPVNAIDPSGLFLQDTSAALSIQTVLAATAYFMLTMPIGTLRIFDSDDVVVPGYLKKSGNGGVNALIGIPSMIQDYKVVRQKVKDCNSTQGSNNCDFSGFPVIVWGNDLPEITQHTQEGISSTGQSFLSYISQNWRTYHHTKPQKKYPGGKFYPSRWYDFTPECPWDNDNPLKFLTPLRKTQACDEYPYSSTLQGGPLNYEQDKVSLKLVNSFQNKTQGSYLLEDSLEDSAEKPQGFYDYASVTPSHPTKSWFGVKVDNTVSTYFLKRNDSTKYNPITGLPVV